MASKLDRLRPVTNPTDTTAPTGTDNTPAAPRATATDLPVFPGYPEWVAIHVSPDVANKYREQAAARNLAPEAVLSERVAKYADLTSVRPIIFDDPLRSRLENLCGVMLKSPEHALERIQQLTRVAINGTLPTGEPFSCTINLPPNALDRLASRKPTSDTPLEQYVASLIEDMILAYVRLN